MLHTIYIYICVQCDFNAENPLKMELLIPDIPGEWCCVTCPALINHGNRTCSLLTNGIGGQHGDLT